MQEDKIDHSLQYTVSSTEVLGYQEDSETGQAVTPPHSPLLPTTSTLALSPLETLENHKIKLSFATYIPKLFTSHF